MATLYGGDITDFLGQDLITGLNRMPAFLVIFLVVVVRGRGPAAALARRRAAAEARHRARSASAASCSRPPSSSRCCSG